MINNLTSTSSWCQSARSRGLALLAAVFLPAAAHSGTPASPAPPPTLDETANWKDQSVTPVSDPILFEDAIIRTEIRPAFGYQRIGNDFPGHGGNLEVYGVQLRYAITDRLAVMINKGGYDDVHPNLGPELHGWANFAGGVKYALIDDKADAFILTPGVQLEVPTGESEIYQGKGSGIWNIFVSSEKGFGNFHLLANVGFLIPNDTNADSTMLHYHAQADYYVCRFFKPFVVVNGYTVLKAGNFIPLNSEGYDLVDFGSSLADGTTQVTVGGGFRCGITKNTDFGMAYEKSVSSVKGLLDDRFTFDFSIRF
jgi:hypothetical protein